MPQEILKRTPCPTCNHQVTLKVCNKLQFERHKIDRPAFMYGDPAKRGTEPTIAEELRAGKYGRNDIFMVNMMNEAGEITDQLMVYPTKSGEPDFGEALPFMDDEEIAWCREENKRILAAEEQFGVNIC